MSAFALAVSHVMCNGKTDETDLTDLNGFFAKNPFKSA
jgi:hypothetical protein